MAGPACPKCGQELPDTALVAHCLDCLTAMYLDRVRERESELLAREPDPLTYLASAKGDRMRHLVLHTDDRQRYCYCGPRATGPQKKWPRPRLSQLPPGVCGDCLDVLGVIQRAALGMAAKGEGL
jgi:hypothetical protein